MQQTTTKEYKAKDDWVGKVIHWELCKGLIFDHTTRWYMHKSVTIQENKTHKIPWDHLIRTRRPDQVD